MLRGSPIQLLAHRYARVVRLWLVAICALSFVVVNVAHAYSHSGQALPFASSQLDNGPLDSGNDVPDASGAVDHCHGCTLIGIAPSVPAMTQNVIIAAAIPLTPRSYFPAPTRADTPPPKATT